MHLRHSVSLAVTLLFCGILGNLNARIVSADISYRCLGGNNYEFTLTAYRDCSSPVDLPRIQRIDYNAPSCSQSGGITVNLVSNKDTIRPACARQATFCEGGTVPGYVKYVYKGNFTIPAQCNDWVFSWQLCLRPQKITTLQNLTQTCLLIETTLDNTTVTCNNSPTFTEDPVALICEDFSSNVSFAAQDSDGDSLVYSFTQPMSAVGTPVTYKAAFSASSPIQSSPAVNLNPTTGNLRLSPTAYDTSVTAVKVEEYRNGQLIGTTIRDLLIEVLFCGNQPPLISGLDGDTSIKTYTMCIGELDTLRFPVLDSNQRDSLTPFFRSRLNGMRFLGGPYAKNKMNDEILIEFEPRANQAGLFNLRFGVSDSACPFPANGVYSIDLDIVNSPRIITRAVPDTAVCGEDKKIGFNINGGTPPFTYKWLSIPNSNTDSLVLSPGTYIVTVEDANGCVDTSEVTLIGDVEADFTFTRNCILQGTTTSFRDTSSSLFGTINAWEWNFGDSAANSTSNQEHPTYAYSDAGTYTVTLKVTDDNGCEATTQKQVQVCKLNSISIEPQKICVQQSEVITVNHDAVCDPELTAVSGNGNPTITNIFSVGDNDSPPSEDQFEVNYPDTGTFQLYISSIFENIGCETTDTVDIEVYPEPELEFLDSNFYWNCQITDTFVVLRARVHESLLPFFPKVDVNSTNLNLNYTLDITDTLTYDTIWITSLPERSAQISASLYDDSTTCVHADELAIRDPISIDISNTPYCERGDSVLFTNLSSSPWGIDTMYLRYGDGNVLANPDTSVYYYPPDSVFQFTFYLRDNSGCEDSTSGTVITELPEDTFDFRAVQPYAWQDTVCFGDPWAYYSPQGSYVNRWEWDFITSTTSFIDDRLRTGTVTITSPGVDTVRHRVIYNKERCERNYSKEVTVFDPIIYDLQNSAVCARFPIDYTATKTSGLFPVDSFRWDFYGTFFEWSNGQRRRVTRLLDSAFTQNVDSVVWNFNGTMRAELTVVDSIGCSNTLVLEHDVVNLIEPQFSLSSFCVKDRLTFLLANVVDSLETAVVYTYEYGDGSPIDSTSTGERFHRFADTGVYFVTSTAYSAEGCYHEYSDSIRIIPRPQPDIVISQACAGKPFVLDGRNSFEYSDTAQVTDYDFILEGTPAGTVTLDGPLTTYTLPEPGRYDVSLALLSSTGCRDTITQTFEVYELVTAAFIDSGDDAFGDIYFYDQSINATNWKYNIYTRDTVLIDSIEVPFGSANATTPYVFDSIGIYLVEQIAWNGLECRDTTMRVVNTNSYINLPNAFSPNQDGENDKLQLLYKGISELYEFKVFNRWGEVVFDAGSDLNDAWDGEFRGTEQPQGTYVYYYRARTIYGETVEEKGKVALLR